MKIGFSHPCGELMEGTGILLREYGHELAVGKEELAIQVNWIQEPVLRIDKRKERAVIDCREKAHFFRGLSLLMQNLDQEIYKAEEKVNFQSNGMMLDCSRNGVVSVAAIKDYLKKQAVFGMNRMYLYMEDTYEVGEYPYLGYLRGRYSQEELRECDRYGEIFGIELIPCIQALAHMRTMLRLPAFTSYQDTEDILLVQSEEVMKFLEACIRQVTAPFRSKRIHLGMDEAAMLGRGKAMDQYGYQEQAVLMKDHLERLAVICRDLGLRPMIWSDIYMTLSYGAKDYYSILKDNCQLTGERMTDEIGLVYWDYYNNDTNFYENYLKLHQQLGNEVLFAGGSWIWNGVAPNTSRAMVTTKAALEACLRAGIQDVFCTAWQDNGAETPVEACLPMLALYGEYGFHEAPELTQVANRFGFCCKGEYRAYLLLDQFDNVSEKTLDSCERIEEIQSNAQAVNPSKYLLYQDVLLGQFDPVAEGLNLKAHYGALAEKLKGYETPLFCYYYKLACLLSKKAELGIELKAAYDQRDKKALEELCEMELKPCIRLARELRRLRDDIWLRENKPFGLENLDIRFGGLEGRLETVVRRLETYLSGETEALEELEAQRLPYDPHRKEKGLCSNYKWESIISTGNIWGI